MEATPVLGQNHLTGTARRSLALAGMLLVIASQMPDYNGPAKFASFGDDFMLRIAFRA
jgi:hypothetical protein